MNSQKIIGVGVVAILLAGAGFWFWGGGSAAPVPAKYDALAQCLKDSGVKFYGAFWCPHCQSQKKIFGKSAKLLPYIECSTPDGKSQKDICRDNKIESYPTWVFADGSTTTGEISIEKLAEKSACALPVAEVATN